MDYLQILREIEQEISPLKNEGEVASYIPQLQKVNPDHFGICLQFLNNDCFGLGHCDKAFSIQSISKVFSVTMVYSMLGEMLWQRVGVEPSGTAFNSLVQLEYEKGIPRNPFMNAGALVVCDILCEHFDQPKDELLKFVRHLAGDQSIDFNIEVALSERDAGYKNIAMANFLKAYGNLHNKPSKVLETYFFMCSIEMSCRQLAQSFLFYAQHGQGKSLYPLTESQGKRLNALMQTCGFYDEAGEFSFKVGLPGKSGVGGGIVAIYPKKYSVAVWSPRLNKKGNSVLGLKALELLTSKSGLSIF